MSFTRPTLSELITRVQVDFVSRLPLEGGVLQRSMVFVLSRVVAGAAHMMYGFLDWIFRQIFPDLSDEAQLIRQAQLFGLTKNPPTFAYVPLALTGTVDGTEVLEDTILVRSDGALYEVVRLGEYDDDAATITAGIAAIVVKSVLAGADYNVAVSEVLTFQSPIAGVNAQATCDEAGIDGSDEESTEELRVRLLERMAEPGQGGSDADWIAWAKQVTGVTRVWVTGLELGPGTVVVRFVRDNDNPGVPADAIPDSGEVADVQAVLDVEKPVHSTPTAFAPTDTPTAYEISIDPDTADNRAAVIAELDDMHFRRGSPGGTVLLSWIHTAIGQAAGIDDYTLVSPVANVTSTTNQLRSRGAMTWS